MIDSPSKIITIEDVMRILSISSRKTIYTYIQQGKLNPINKDDWHIEGRYEFNLEDVARLKEELKKPGLTTKEVAEQLDISVTTVNKYIKQELLPAFQEEYRGINCYFVHEEDLKEFERTHKVGRKPSKRHFYNNEKNIALFQLFVKKQNEKEEFARIISVENPIMAITEKHQELTLEELLHKGFEASYTIESKKIITKEGYATFVFKQTAYAKSTLYKLVDLFYQYVSPTNMRITPQEEKEQFLIEIKPVLLTESSQELVELLESVLVSGKINKRSRGIYIDSDLEVIRVKVTSDLKEELQQKAKELGKRNIEELLLYAVQKL
ncbi:MULTISPECIES: helix-turn-helix domain-containing protein [Priestia]|uniref:helix-turn-helix domain-containing protein n=1 Tax=Priestia TaxID=2800373 RepID=UPI001C8E643A|nr:MULTISPECIES: helix-turn-helix domain-containing protein [Priestia]MBY0061243.1 helix-turn-helix domain-containing protein [Priestia aryabhattai]MDN3361767.1 helix-turn-helix domain-containing protein [Priestia megaterium]WKU22223.1 helix-turn-helix domain-containing protein [Priestia megaterium]